MDMLLDHTEARRVSDRFSIETVTRVRHWTDSLFSFRTSRETGQTFKSGQFAMVGLLPHGGVPLVRAYAFASPAAEPTLEFYSIKVADGPLTSKLQHVRPGDAVLVGRARIGALALCALRPGRRLFLIGTGTGLAPWLSLIRDPEVYAQFDEVILVHSVRSVPELTYRDLLTFDLYRDPHVGSAARRQFRYYPCVTRRPFRGQLRITDMIVSRRLFNDLETPPLDARTDRLMLCGGPGLLADMPPILSDLGFEAGALERPGDYVAQKAFFG